MADGVIRYKAGFTAVQNTVARNDKLPLRAKGLFLVIQAHITIPDRVYKKSDFFNMACEGEKAFESAWNDLKEAGYLKTHIYTKNGKFVSEYELLDEAKPGPHTFYYDKFGKVSRTNLDLKDQRAVLAEKQRENRRVEPEAATPTEENDRTPEKGGTVRYPHNCTYGNGTYADGTYGNGIYANGGNNNNTTITFPVDNESNTDNKTNNKNSENNILKNPLLLQTETVTTEAESVKPDMFEEEEEEKIKKQISYDRLIRKHCDSENKKLLTFIVRQMTEMIHEPGSMVKISTNHSEPKTKVIERLKSITYDDIENLLYMLPDKKENYIKNPIGYMRNCLFNIVDRRGAICYTNQIKHKGNNQGLIHQEYDFDELEKTLFGG